MYHLPWFLKPNKIGQSDLVYRVWSQIRFDRTGKKIVRWKANLPLSQAVSLQPPIHYNNLSILLFFTIYLTFFHNIFSP